MFLNSSPQVGINILQKSMFPSEASSNKRVGVPSDKILDKIEDTHILHPHQQSWIYFPRHKCEEVKNTRRGEGLN